MVHGLRLSALGVLLAPLGIQAIDLYVSPYGTPPGPGTIGQPYDLATALSGGVGQAGDTFWLRGGNYALGRVGARIQGAPGNPITFRPMPGEKPRVDGSISFFDTMGYVILRDFELYSSDTNRASSQTGVGFDVTDIQVITGIASYSPNLSFINMIVHNHTRHGFHISDSSSNNLVYGCVVFNNGWVSPDNAEGHGVQARGAEGATEISDNVVFNNSGANMHIYEDGSGLRLVGLRLERNVAFNASAIQDVRAYRDWLVGVDAPAVSADGIVLRNNMGYYPPDARAQEEVQIGRQGFNGSVILLNNYFPQGLSMNNWSNAIVMGNLLAAQRTYIVRLDQTQVAAEVVWDNNTYVRRAAAGDFARNSTEYDFSGWQNTTGYDQNSSYSVGNLSGTQVFVRPNRYEPGRANIIVYNWDDAETVSVDVRSVLMPGAAYEVRNTQDFLAPPVLSGNFDGEPLELPMTGLTVAAPNGPLLTPSPTGPTFNVFILLPLFVRLQIATVDGKAELSWPVNSGNWVLQVSASAAGGWIDDTNTPAIRGDQYVVGDRLSEGGRFYRLRGAQ